MRVFPLLRWRPLVTMTVAAGLLPGGLVAFALAAQKPPARPAAKAAAPAPKLDYNRDVRPILAAKCFACHGPDLKSLQAGLRLDSSAEATKLLQSGHRAIVPGKPQASELVKRIHEPDATRMPPVYSQKKLTDEEKQILTRWVAEGAEYKKHWAFVAPVRPPLPAVSLKTWPKNGIDRFILARLEKEGLKPSPQADRATLLRRVSLDLTGVPPTPEQVDSFLRDRAPNAYEKVVDRLLASPQYGERMAMDWLDGARYADSNGYQADYERYMWRWRDWVIDAFNKNMPFDQFAVEQIAGDLLPNCTLDQKIATGFNRNHRINTEGGVIPEEWRVETVVDRVETTSQVWLGLTMGCARCHDHKYDPITQRDFYRFFAFFNNVSETGSGVEQPVNHPPFVKAPTPEQELRLAQLDATVKGLDGKLDVRLGANMAHAAAWKLDDLKADDASLQQGILARYALTAQPAVTSGKADVPKAVGKVLYEAGRVSGAVVTDGMAYVDLGQAGDFDTKQAFSYGAWVNPTSGNGSPIAKMDKAADYRGWDIFMNGGRPAAHLINKWPMNALKVTAKDMIPNGQWTHILVTYDGSAKPEGLRIYINGKQAQTDVEANTLTETIRTPVTTKIGTRTGADGFAGKVDDVALYHRALTAEEVARLAGADPARGLLAVAPEKRTDEQKREIARLWSLRNDADYRTMAADRDKAAGDRTMVDGQVTTVMVMDEMPKPRECYVLLRGQYDHHGDPVTAGVPETFPAIPKGYAANRLGLAKWIVDPSNPLTARVAVNRLWEKLFGTGIVSTSEDFGTRAEFPSHPELLDWLATEFVRLRWDLKAIQKEMVMSATYRQSSRITPALLAKDPANRLLARGPRFRLPAEVIRDQALAASGLLVEKVGGPSVRPYQPDGLWDETSVYGNLHNYKHDTGDGLYRRSLYTIWKRTAAPPTMTLFDASTRETCRVRRFRTNTPLQALVTLNEITFVEAARVLAQRMIEEGGSTPESRISYGFRRALSHSPAPQDAQTLLGSLRRWTARYKAKPDEAKKLIAVGDAKVDPKIDPSDLAAYTLVASVILNTDEAITKE